MIQCNPLLPGHPDLINLSGQQSWPYNVNNLPVAQPERSHSEELHQEQSPAMDIFGGFLGAIDVDISERQADLVVVLALELVV